MIKHTNDYPKEAHGTAKSYVMGFIVSLFLTGQAYYLVVDKTFTGNTLLAMILSLAITQMAVQIYFFLHLGRGPKPLYNVGFFGGTIAIILIVVVGSIFIMNNLQYNMAPSEVTRKLAQDEAIAKVGGRETGACQTIGVNHRIIINSSSVNPLFTQASRCDTLTFINESNRTYDIMFGTHPVHQNYGGESHVPLRKNYAKTITLNQSGIFNFHEDVKYELSGSFKVLP